jgi:hypothetical protein
MLRKLTIIDRKNHFLKNINQDNTGKLWIFIQKNYQYQKHMISKMKKM